VLFLLDKFLLNVYYACNGLITL